MNTPIPSQRDQDDELWSNPSAIVPAAPGTELVTMTYDNNQPDGGWRTGIQHIVAWMLPNEYSGKAFPVCPDGVYPSRSMADELELAMVAFRVGEKGTLYERNWHSDSYDSFDLFHYEFMRRLSLYRRGIRATHTRQYLEESRGFAAEE